jgi:outer membrane biosynthesis protein TonB
VAAWAERARLADLQSGLLNHRRQLPFWARTLRKDPELAFANERESTMRFANFAVLAGNAMIVSALALGCASDPNKEIVEANEAKKDDHQKTEKAKAELQQEHRETVVDENKKIVDAQAKLEEERKDLATEADKRLAAADKKANEVKQNAKKASAAKKAGVEATWNTYNEQRQRAGAKRAAIDTVRNDAFAEAKRDLEASLDELDATVDAMKSKL